MFPADFAYARPGSVAGALAQLEAAEAAGNDVKVLAGGQSLLPMMKLRLAAPAALLDIGDLTELKGVSLDGGSVRIGALTTYRDLQRDPRVAAGFPAIADALDVLADPQVRARGTIGGALAHGDPAADLPAVLLALGAHVTIASRTRTRTVALADFLLGVFHTDLAAHELITAVTIPVAPPGQAYEKFPQPASHLPLAGACTVIEAEGEAIASVRVCVTGIAPRAFRAHLAERELRSRPVPALLAQLSGSGSPGSAGLPGSPGLPGVLELDAMLAGAIAGSLASTGTKPLADQHASGPFRVHLAGVMARRALARALSRAEGEAGAA